MPSAATSGIRIALVSDTHTNFSREGDPSLYRERLSQVIVAVNAACVDVVIVAGDLTENGTEAQFAEFQHQSKGFSAPLLVVPGNHDVGGKHLPNAPGPATRERVQQYENWFGPSFWQRSIGGVKIIGMNSLLMGTGFDKEREQWAFLERMVEAPAIMPAIAVLHQPLFLEKADEPGGDYWNIEPVPRSRLLALLSQGKVRAVLSGHIHRSLQHQVNRILFVTTPPVSFGLPVGKQPQGWTLMTVPPAQGSPITSEIQIV